VLLGPTNILSTMSSRVHKINLIPIKMFKSKKIRWVGHVTGMGRREINIGFWWETQKD
jgi:hypothetical protein